MERPPFRPLLARFCRKHEAEEIPEPATEIRSLPVIESQTTDSVGTQSITLDEFKRLEQSEENVVLLDVRTERSREPSALQAKGSVRMPPENVVIQANKLKLPKDAWLIAYCA